MIQFKTIYKYSFLFLLLIVYLIGGSISYTFGIPNTLMTMSLISIMILVYGLYVFKTKRIVVIPFVKTGIVFVFLIFLSAILNQTHIVKTLTYLIFPLLPLSVFLFLYINYKEKYISKFNIFKIMYFIAAFQLPFLIIQRLYYDTLIKFNNSGQVIEWYDFMFGTFFIKSDHTLGLFVLLLSACILFNYNNIRDKIKHPIFSIILFGTIIFTAESNISKLFFSIAVFVSYLGPLYKKYKKTLLFKGSILVTLLLLLIAALYLKEQPFIQSILGGRLERQFSLPISRIQYANETAKRVQILLMMIFELDKTFIGGGPYSYFNILTGEFTKTKHFSQMIWSYFDLGILGLLVVYFYLLSFVRFLDIPRGLPFLTLLLVLVVYSIYTTIYSEIGLLLAVILIFNKEDNEHNNSTIPRLEEK